MKKNNLNILITDDHAMILQGLRAYIGSERTDYTIFTAATKAEMDEHLENQTIDVLLLDLMIGKTDARFFIQSIKKKYADLKIIVVSSHETNEVIQTLIDNDVDGFVGKSQSSEFILKAIDQSQENLFYLDPQTRKKWDNAADQSKTGHIHLTKREQEVLRETLKGSSIKVIADALFISEKTIENHRSNLFSKFEVKNVTSLVKKAMLLGFHEA
ncbi:MAG: LuxR C-terminal-related transcriptional regulator [Bacteroidota bacterium]